MITGRIVQSDNFGMSGEQPGKDEVFILWEMPIEDCAKIVEVLNNHGDSMSPYFYRVVQRDYKLMRFEP